MSLKYEPASVPQVQQRVTMIAAASEPEPSPAEPAFELEGAAPPLQLAAAPPLMVTTLV